MSVSLKEKVQQQGAALHVHKLSKRSPNQSMNALWDGTAAGIFYIGHSRYCSLDPERIIQWIKKIILQNGSHVDLKSVLNF